MLQLRPVCEHCAKALPPESQEAMICSFECTFCHHCVENLLQNVCPNCGGGFCARPIRPMLHWNGENYLEKYPAEKTPRHRPVDLARHAQFAADIRSIPPEKR